MAIFNMSADSSRGALEETLDDIHASELNRLVPTFIYLALIAVWGTIGNGLVLYVYLKHNQKSCYRLFIIWLSGVNLCTCCLDIPLAIATLAQEHILENIMLCKISRFTSLLCTLSSCFLLMFICIDRYRKLCQFTKRPISLTVAKVMCGASLGLGVLFSWPGLLLFGLKKSQIKHHNVTGKECSIDDLFKDTAYPMVAYIISTVAFALSVVIMICFYSLIGKFLYKKSKNSLTVQKGIAQNPEETAARKTLPAFLITLSYVISYLPLLLLALIRGAKSDFISSMNEQDTAAYKFFLRSYYISCAIHPIIYAKFDTIFKIAYKKMLPCCRHIEQSSSESSGELCTVTTEISATAS